MKQKTFKPVFEEEAALIKLDGAVPQKYSDADFSLASKSGDYLPRLQLLTSNSDICKEGKFPVNHYALVNGQTNRDLGEAVDVLVVSWRPKAIEMGDEVITIHDPKHAEFIRIQEKSETKDSGCMYGPEFLVYIPSVKEFATFFLGSKSGRRESPSVKARLQKACTLKSHLITTPKYKWQAPLGLPCSTPFDIPAIEEITKQAEKFANPPSVTVERVSEAEKAQAAGRAR